MATWSGFVYVAFVIDVFSFFELTVDGTELTPAARASALRVVELEELFQMRKVGLRRRPA